jgi:hypothetical protein
MITPQCCWDGHRRRIFSIHRQIDLFSKHHGQAIGEEEDQREGCFFAIF